jgi:hypothetical protein
MRLRVVCGFGVTIATFSPTSRFNKLLLPTLGRPSKATRPACRVAGVIVCNTPSTFFGGLELPGGLATEQSLSVQSLECPTGSGIQR